MNLILMRLSTFTALYVAVVSPSGFSQQVIRPIPKAISKEQTQFSLAHAAIQSRIALYSDTTKGQCHAEDARQYKTVAERFIAALSERDTKQVLSHCSVPIFLEDERLIDQESVAAHMSKLVFPGVFALAKNKKILILDTLEQLEQLLDKRVPGEARKMWAEHITRSSRIAVVSGGPMLVGLSLRKTNERYTISGLLFAYFPKQDALILKAVTEGSKVNP